MATFKIAFTFKVTGRGLVLAGDVLEGSIRVGNRIRSTGGSPLDGKSIKGIEWADNITAKTSKTALVIPVQSAEELSDLLGLPLEGQVIEIED